MKRYKDKNSRQLQADLCSNFSGKDSIRLPYTNETEV
jgi:hypothetical protein